MNELWQYSQLGLIFILTPRNIVCVLTSRGRIYRAYIHETADTGSHAYHSNHVCATAHHVYSRIRTCTLTTLDHTCVITTSNLAYILTTQVITCTLTTRDVTRHSSYEFPHTPQCHDIIHVLSSCQDSSPQNDHTHLCSDFTRHFFEPVALRIVKFIAVLLVRYSEHDLIEIWGSICEVDKIR